VAKTVANERAYWLAWSRVKDVGPVTIKRLWEHFGTLAVAWRSEASELLAVDGIGLLSAEKIVLQRPHLNPEKLLTQHESENQAFWTPADPDYPALLFAIADPPPVLYYRGPLRLSPNQLSVGIVGTRKPSSYGHRWTQRLSSQLTRQGAIIVSGLALGIDTAAHSSCLKQQGPTVAVLGTGVDVVYPQRNRELYEQILATGLVVSEYPDGTLPDKAHFPRRNRLIAGLSRAILVTEAPERSGALITARLANDYCRDVYALPCALDNPQGKGCLHLIQQGAQIILDEPSLIRALVEIPSAANGWPTPVSTAEHSQPSDATTLHLSICHAPDRNGSDQLDKLHTGDSHLVEPNSKLSPLLASILAAMPPEPVALDRLVLTTQLATGEVLSALFQLELMELIRQLPGAQYQRV
jgi:DNA processing protein